MDPSTGRPVIEGIDDLTALESEPVGPPEQTHRVAALAALAAVGVICAALLLIGSALSTREDAVAPQASSSTVEQTTTTIEQTTTTTQATPVVPDPASFVPWPELPEDHDPIITIIPGAGEPIFETLANTTLVYVNSLGRPTVVDLDTGTISSVIIASTRSRDSFAVELGNVVSPDGSSRSLPKATPRAIEFFTFPAGAASFSDTQLAGTAPGALLCLSQLPCEVTGWQSSKSSRGVDEFRRLTVEEDAELHEALFGENWTLEGIYRYPPDGQYQDLRLPIPLNDEAWIIHQPLDPSNASS